MKVEWTGWFPSRGSDDLVTIRIPTKGRDTAWRRVVPCRSHSHTDVISTRNTGRQMVKVQCWGLKEKRRRIME